ncbi:MAG: DNA polymerase, partial [Coriobacteriaceae bacterium]|nr:DNA polymerase [Coriobacteriaceae bacterium]
TAARVFGVPVSDVTPQMRSRAKAVNFGIVYGQQAYGLSQSLRIGFGEAQEMIDRYFSVYPQVRAYLDAVVARATETGYAETMFGRKRHIPELSEGNRQRRQFGERTAMNHPMQGSAADIIKKAMVDVQRKLSAGGFGAKMILQVHDELCFSVPEAEMDAVQALVKDTMENVVELRVPLVVDANYGANWGQAH